MPKMNCAADARVYVARITQLLQAVAPKRQGPGAVGCCPVSALVEAARRLPKLAAAFALQGYNLNDPQRAAALRQILERWRLGGTDLPKSAYLLDALALLFAETTDAKGRAVLLLRPEVARTVAVIVEENRHRVGRKPAQNTLKGGMVQPKNGRKKAA